MAFPVVLVFTAAAGTPTLPIVVAPLAASSSISVIIAGASEGALTSILGAGERPIVQLSTEPLALAPPSVILAERGMRVRIEGETLRAAGAEAAGGEIAAALAEAFGEAFVAVVLAGAQVDAIDLDAVRNAGGTVVHEFPGGNGPDLAVHDGDLVAPADRLVAVVDEILAQRDEGPSDPVARLLADVLRNAGIDFREYKPATVMRRLARLMAADGATDMEEYLYGLRRRPEGYATLVRSLLINVTEFFRDPALFEYLRDDVVPELIAYARQHGGELRIWSAGCATGEEAYSLAILFSEALGEDLPAANVRIFATDVDEETIAVARRGVYPNAAVAELPQELRARYFAPVDDEHVEVRKVIRNLTVFGQHDLAQRAPFPRIDLCLCRNVLIYFGKDLQQRTLQLFAFSLRADGYLVLGKAETTSPLPEYFAPVDRTLKVYRRHGPRVLIPPVRGRGSAYAEPHGSAGEPRNAVASAVGAMLSAVRRPGAAAANGEAIEHPRADEKLLGVVLDSPVGIVVVDRRYDILAINSAARTALNVRGVGVGEDLIHSAGSVTSAALRATIDATFVGEVAGTFEFETSDAADDATRTILVSTFPQRDGETVSSVAIVLVDVTSQAHARSSAERHLIDTREALRDLEARNERLVARQRSLSTANDELSGANADLRMTNEHLLISAEEAASAAEEIETLNEEMQATNEELETLNEELQATVEELNTTNDELEARSGEYQELAASREQQRLVSTRERERFVAALDRLDPIAIVDEHGIVLHANAAWRALARDGRPLSDGRDLLSRLAAEPGEERRRIGAAGDARDYVVRVRPLDGGEKGSVVWLRPLDEGAEG